jgi:hypothetical protein
VNTDRWARLVAFIIVRFACCTPFAFGEPLLRSPRCASSQPWNAFRPQCRHLFVIPAGRAHGYASEAPRSWHHDGRYCKLVEVKVRGWTLSTHALLKQVPKESATRYGCIVHDPASNQVLHYVEKPEKWISSLINGGVYLFDKSFFEEVKSAMDTKEKHAA